MNLFIKAIEDFFSYIYNKVFNLFIWASGANAEVLKSVPSESNKYFGIGGTIIFTALMASFAGGYAFFTAFKSVPLSFFFGCFWGLLILNLDRYIVSSFGVGDGKRTISGQEIIEAAPRLLMAILLGIVISTPLEIKIFEKEIEVEIKKLINKKKNEISNSDSTNNKENLELKKILAEKNNEKEKLKNELKNAGSGPGYLIERLKELETKHKKLEGEYNKSAIEESKAYNDWQSAVRKPNNNSEIARLRGIYTTKKQKYEKAEADFKKVDNELSRLRDNKDIDIDQNISNLKTEISKIENEIKSLEAKKIKYENRIELTRQEAEDVTKRYNGFAARLEAMEEITNEHAILWYAKWLITLLFVFIEIAPILFKMMTERGPYDDIMDRLKYEIKVEQLLQQSNLNEEINTAVEINNQKNIQILEAEMMANQEILKAIAEAQAEIAKEAILRWKEEQILKAKQNPNNIVS